MGRKEGESGRYRRREEEGKSKGEVEERLWMGLETEEGDGERKNRPTQAEREEGRLNPLSHAGRCPRRGDKKGRVSGRWGALTPGALRLRRPSLSPPPTPRQGHLGPSGRL